MPLNGQTHTHGSLTVRQFPCLSDNYGFLIHDPASGETAAVDTPDADEIAAQADALGWRISHILNTHWHPDHTGGNQALADRYDCQIVAPRAEADKIPAHTTLIEPGETVHLGDQTAAVIDVGGHTLGHIAYHFAGANVAFVGDAVFSLGCGRLFEGTPEQMWASLCRLRALPDDTTLYCAHEYTQANAAFAVSVDPDNEVLAARKIEIERLRAAGEPTVPMRLSAELPINPFLRADDETLAAAVGLSGAKPADVFAEVRRRKDAF